MLKIKPCFLSLVLIFHITFPCLAFAWSGKVIGVADGDTITVLQNREQVKIRLYGIDCPEKGQAFGTKAKQFTSDMVFGKIVKVKRIDTDRYGRTVAMVAVGVLLLNEELVKAGLAWVYDYYCDKPICESWKWFQLWARQDKRGLWSDPNPVPPWEYRRKRRK